MVAIDIPSNHSISSNRARSLAILVERNFLEPGDEYKHDTNPHTSTYTTTMKNFVKKHCHFQEIAVFVEVLST